MNSTRLPLAIRGLNAGLAALAKVGPRLPRLQPAELLQTARRQTGLSDYGSDYFREPLQRLCHSLEQDARLTAFGRIIARQDLLRLLRNRLMLEESFSQHPQIAAEQIKAPVFILGMKGGAAPDHVEDPPQAFVVLDP